MKKSGLIALGVFSYLLFMLILTPASVWLQLVPLPAGVQLGQVQGLLTQGSVSQVIHPPLVLHNVRWQLSLASLWRGELGVTVDAGSSKDELQPFVHLRATRGMQQTQLTDVTVRLPVGPLLQNIQLPMSAEASGALVLNINQWQLGTPYCQQLAGQVSWQQAQFKSPIGWLDLKQINGKLSCQQGNLQLVTDGNNPLGLAVTASLQAGRYQLQGVVNPDSSMPKEVHDAMRFVGPQDAQGRYPIQLAGQIR